MDELTVVKIFKMRNLENVSIVSMSKMLKLKQSTIRQVLKRAVFADAHIPAEYLIRQNNGANAFSNLLNATRFCRRNPDWHLLDVASKFEINIVDLEKELNLIRFDAILKRNEKLKEQQQPSKRRESELVEGPSLLPSGSIRAIV